MTQLPDLRIVPGKGLRYKDQFSEFVNIQRLFSIQMSLLDPIMQKLLESCLENHLEFSQKCSHPLWKNPEFYIRLPFKKNGDINPTKANHSGMNPEHLALAQKECSK